MQSKTFSTSCEIGYGKKIKPVIIKIVGRMKKKKTTDKFSNLSFNILRINLENNKKGLLAFMIIFSKKENKSKIFMNRNIYLPELIFTLR